MSSIMRDRFGIVLKPNDPVLVNVSWWAGYFMESVVLSQHSDSEILLQCKNSKVLISSSSIVSHRVLSKSQPSINSVVLCNLMKLGRIEHCEKHMYRVRMISSGDSMWCNHRSVVPIADNYIDYCVLVE